MDADGILSGLLAAQVPSHVEIRRAADLRRQFGPRRSPARRAGMQLGGPMRAAVSYFAGGHERAKSHGPVNVETTSFRIDDDLTALSTEPAGSGALKLGGRKLIPAAETWLVGASSCQWLKPRAGSDTLPPDAQ